MMSAPSKNKLHVDMAGSPRRLLPLLAVTGCFALRCNRCPCAFCAWCLEDCGGDAHAHVANTCVHKPRGAQVYHGSQADFEAQNLRRRRRLLGEHLMDLEPGLRRKVLRVVAGDLRDVGLGEFAAMYG